MGNQNSENKADKDFSMFSYWGKSNKKDPLDHHLLVYHCLDVASVGWVALERFPKWHQLFSEKFGLSLIETQKLIGWLLALHDIGKFSSAFQKKVPILYKVKNDFLIKAEALHHSDLGWVAWEKKLTSQKEVEDYGDTIFCILKNTVSSSVFQACASLLRAITGHHGKPPQKNLGGSLDSYFSTENSDHLSEYVYWINQFFEIEKLHFFKETDCQIDSDAIVQTSWWFAGFAVFCDWLGSNDDVFKYEPQKMDLKTYWLERATPSAKKAVSETGIEVCMPSREQTLVELFSAITVPTPLQKMIDTLKISSSPTLYILEDVMGAGKTEAALALAHKLVALGQADGLYFGLPTMATADSMFNRVETVYRSFFDEKSHPNVMLAHSANRLNTQFLSAVSNSNKSIEYKGDSNKEFTATAECSSWLSDSRKKALLADIGVGTIDQVLLGILPVKHQSLRLFGLYNKVLILDEVHASDTYMHGLTQKLLEFHASIGGSVILLSATLPKSTKQELLASFKKGLGQVFDSNESLSFDYPLLTSVDAQNKVEIPIEASSNSKRTVAFRLIDQESEVLSYILEKSHRYCVVWIRNTVQDAIMAYQKLCKELGEDNVVLFHARFTLGDRWRIQEDIVGRFGKVSVSNQRQGRIVISTQVVEQSLDLDFDYMVSDLAPIDLLIQRIGRLQRHTRDAGGSRSDVEQRHTPELIVFSPSPQKDCTKDWVTKLLPGTSAVYDDHGELWLTSDWISRCKKIKIPEQLREAVEYVYDKEDIEEKIPASLIGSVNRADGKDSAKSFEAKQVAIKRSTGYSIEGAWEDDIVAKTRLGEDVIKIRLARWIDGKLCPWNVDQDDKPSWFLSEVQVRKVKIASEYDGYSRDIQKAIEDVKETWPKKGEYELVVVMFPEENYWVGKAKNLKGDIVAVQYSEREGLSYGKQRR